MTNQTFETGQRVYSAGGASALYVAKIGSGHVVQPFILSDCDEDGYYNEGIDLWDKVYAKPPREVLDAECQRLREQVVAIRQELTDLQSQRQSLASERQALMDRLQQHEALRYLDDFLNAKITHYVLQDGEDGGWKVLDTKAFCDARPYGYYERTLTLYAGVRNNKQDLAWKIKNESSLSHKEIFAFPSEELATEKARSIVAAELQKQIQEVRKGYVYQVDRVVRNAQALAVPIPAELTAAVSEYRRAEAEAAKAAALKALAEADAKLQAIPAAIS